MSRSSLALDNLRAFVVLLVLSFHSVLAYLAFLPATPFGFNDPPYAWRSFPIVDTRHWFGFDLYCAWQDVFLMSLLFFLSGLFVGPSLVRKGVRVFLQDRLVRLAIPFVLVVALLMPVAHYPTYLQTAADPSIAAYWQHWLALPFWPSGPAWFLWVLLVGQILAAGLHRAAPAAGEALAAWSLAGDARPQRYFTTLLLASALAYVPMALLFTPGSWFQAGPFAFQLSRPLHYVVYFFAGLGAGAYGLDRGLLAPNGTLARRWKVWLPIAPASFLLWACLMGLTIDNPAAPIALQLFVGLAFVLACASSCFLLLGLFVRFAARRVRILDGLRSAAYGMYLVHYVFVVWLQYALLNISMPAVVKAAIVFVGTVLLSWATVAAALRWIPAATQVIGTGRRVQAKAS